MNKIKLLCFSILFLAGISFSQNERNDDFDRLDGKGKSGKKVDVIEWENNLEVHVYPQGSLAKLGALIDRTQNNKAVMVFEYTFNNTPEGKGLVRRNILSIPLKDEFFAYLDTSVKGYDKVVISNLSGLEKLEKNLQIMSIHKPTSLFPEGYEEEKKKYEESKKAPSTAPPPANTEQKTSDSVDSSEIKSFSW